MVIARDNSYLTQLESTFCVCLPILFTGKVQKPIPVGNTPMGIDMTRF
ncbi:hypothetical protein CASFOL_011041 [Castilleja foliolosa]|uniref:Uncharacterized protein n=1 Tax=Castilleja foliolosa TaxID=1961234 RepID=A0ABD3DUB9_9LAMI